MTSIEVSALVISIGAFCAYRSWVSRQMRDMPVVTVQIVRVYKVQPHNAGIPRLWHNPWRIDISCRGSVTKEVRVARNLGRVMEAGQWYDVIHTHPLRRGSEITYARENGHGDKIGILSAHMPSTLAAIVLDYSFPRVFLAVNEMSDLDSSKIDWRLLLENHTTIDLLRESQGKIDWHMLSDNPAAIELLRSTLGKLDYTAHSTHPVPSE